MKALKIEKRDVTSLINADKTTASAQK